MMLLYVAMSSMIYDALICCNFSGLMMSMTRLCRYIVKEIFGGSTFPLFLSGVAENSSCFAKMFFVIVGKDATVYVCL